MSIFDMFRGNSSTAVANNAPGNVQKPADPKATQANPAADPVNLPPNGEANPTTDAPKSPLDEFKNLWDTPKNAPTDPRSQPLLTNDPAKFAAATKQLNFAANIDPQLVTKALAGDPQAFKDAINIAAQEAFAASANFGTQTLEGATQKNNQRTDEVLEKKFKEFMLKQQTTDNPVLNHPATAPILDLTKRQLLAANPGMSPFEIQAKAEQYVQQFAQQFTENSQQKAAAKSGPDPFDFSNYGI